MLFARTSNDAVAFNPSTADGTLTTHGSDFYWAFFSLFAVAAIAFGVFSLRADRANRIFYNLATVILVISSVGYFTLASNLGQTSVLAEYSAKQVAGYREIFYARFIDYFLTLPLVVLAPLLLTDLLYSQIAPVLFAVDFAVVNLLIASLIPSIYKWAYYTFALASIVYVAFVLLFTGRRGAVRLEVGTHYTVVSGVIVLVFAVYPLAFGLSQGANVISLDSEAVFFGVLDLILKPILSTYFIFGIRDLSLEKFGLRESRLENLVESKHGAPRASDATAAHVPDANVVTA